MSNMNDNRLKPHCFLSKLIALQGHTMMSTPYLLEVIEQVQVQLWPETPNF